MSAWGWYRARRWWTKVLVGAPALLFIVAALYVAGRTLQFFTAEKEAGLYVPATANVVVRAKDLARHWERLQESGAWRVIRRRILRDPAIRPALNALLKDQGAPTLDELEDERNSDVYSTDLLMRGAGRDAAAALQVGDAWSPLRWFVVTRVRWSDYLLLPFARLLFPVETRDGTTILRFPWGLVALEGRLVMVSNDRALLLQALLRKGTESADDRPVTARIEFGNSRALLAVRQAIRDSGALPQIRMDSVRAIEVAADLEGLAAHLDIAFEGAEATRADTPAPHAFLRLAPPNTTGAVVSSTGPQDLFEWLRSLIRTLGPNDPVGRIIKEALEALDESGFSSEFLPKIDGGMAILTGAQDGEDGARVYPALAILVASKDPKAAVEALVNVIKKRAGFMGESKFGAHTVGDVQLWSFEFPRGAQVNDFFRPCFAAIPGAFVFGNNLRFTQAILEEAAAGGTGATGGVSAKKLREHGISTDPSLAGGHLLLPALRESLDGPIPQVAKFLVSATINMPQFRAQLDAELKEQKRVLPEPEVAKLFYARLENKERDKEDELRGSLHPLDFMKWMAFSLQPGGKDATLRAAIEFK
jgi:hypothetical protein